MPCSIPGTAFHLLNSHASSIVWYDIEKAPLKDYIFEFTQDAHYRDEKTKERSLRLVKSPAYKAGVKHSGDKVIALLEDFSPVCFGMWSINMDLAHQKYPMGVPFASGISDKDSESIASGPEWDLSKLVGWETVRK